MALQFEITSDTPERTMSARLGRVDRTKANKSIAELLYNVAQQSFENEESPEGEDWAALSPATLQIGFKNRYPDSQFYETVQGQRVMTAEAERYVQGKRILQEQGMKGGLRALATDADEEGARLGSRKPYALIQQLGSDGPMEGFIKAPLKARPYAGVSDDDRRSISKILRRAYLRSLQDDS